MFTLSVLDPYQGDFAHSWDPNDENQVKNAREMFDNLRKTGYMVYETKTVDGNVVHEVVHTFDAVVGKYQFEEPKEEKQLTARPAAAGG